MNRGSRALLLVEPDADRARVCSQVLRGDGWEILRAATPAEARAVAPLPPVVVADAELVLAGALDRVPGSGLPGAPRVVLLAARHLPEASLDRAKANLDVALVLRRPVSFLDLADRLRGLAAPAPSPARPLPLRAGPVDRRNAFTVARLWVTRATGELSHADRAAGTRATVKLLAGGPPEPADLGRIDQALRGGDLDFVRRPLAGEGLWAELGRLLFQRLRDPRQGGFVERHRFRAVARTPWSPAARALGLDPRLADLVERADGRTPLGELVARSGLDEAEASPDLACLKNLRLLEFSSPRRSAIGAAGPSSVSTTSVVSGRRGRARVAEGFTRSVGSSSGSGHDPASLRRRLRAEAERLGKQPPTVVLGVPADAGRAEVRSMAQRMRRRYRRLADDAALPRDVRRLAEEVLELVENAAARLGADDRPAARPWENLGGYNPTSDVVTRSGSTSSVSGPGTILDWDEEQLLELGRKLIADRDFARADKVLSRARSKRLDHPAVLSNLAWARYKNARRPGPERIQDARDLFLLAEQFGPSDRDTVRLFPRFLVEQGELRAALARVRRGLRLHPDDADLRELERVIRQRLDED